MKYLLMICAALFAVPAMADEILLNVERVTAQDGIVRALVRLDNASSQPFRVITIACAFLDENGVAVEMNRAAAHQVPPGGRVYQEVRAVHSPAMRSTRCYVDFRH